MNRLVVASAVALLLVLAACELLTNAGQSAGILPQSSTLVEGAKAVDAALGGWVWAVLFGGPPAAVAAVKGTKAVVRRRRERRSGAATLAKIRAGDGEPPAATS